MAIHEISVEQAYALREEDSSIPYLDVRSVPEFEQGHPAGAYNLPLLHFDPATQQMQPNPEFQHVVEQRFPKDRPVIVGCKTGGRSAHAATIMEQLGYTTLYNVLGGFHGHQDPYGNVYPGWADEGLPTSTSSEPGHDYASLRGGG